MERGGRSWEEASELEMGREARTIVLNLVCVCVY